MDGKSTHFEQLETRQKAESIEKVNRPPMGAGANGEMRKIAALGALLNAALFLAGVFAACLVVRDQVGVVLALLAAGASALCYAAQAGHVGRPVIWLLAALSWACAVGSGISFAMRCFA